MLELPELTPEYFEILVVRELRKVGLEVPDLRVHRRAMLAEPERGYLLELKGRVSRAGDIDRKSTRLNSSHVSISYAVFCLKNKRQVNAFTHIQTNTHITGSFNRLTNTPDIPPQTKT